ncbi:MAG: methyltransferase domain-containing protein [Alistipes sp.]|nr:methyltransferase domain-containing protein [Alistipes sp.]
MFKVEDIEILCSESVRQAIEENIGRKSTDIALDRRVPHASIVATQVKNLQKARTKLPSYFAARAIVPTLAYEQSSSEECAERKELSGDSVLDLTCGLGVDALALSKRFRRVVTIERNEGVAAVARENFRRLRVDNIEVVCASAEEYLAGCTDHFDWCFSDPDRRGAKGEKLVRLEDCSPNVVTLMPRLKQIADKVCIKCSPLFDVDEAFRLFGDCSVECISLGGEAKEVNIYIDGLAGQRLSAVAIGIGKFSCKAEDRGGVQWSCIPEDFTRYRYITLPDVSLQHARMVAAAFNGKSDVWSNNGVALSEQRPEGVLGRTFEIEAIYNIDSAFKRVIKGVKAEIYRREFPLSNAEICKRYRCSEGGTEKWCFTRIGEKYVAIKMNKI